MANLKSIELGSDHEPSVGVGRVGWMNRVLLPNRRRVTFIPATKLPPLALDSTDLAGCMAFGVYLVRSPNTSIGARVLCMTLANISFEPHALLFTAAGPVSCCCSLR